MLAAKVPSIRRVMFDVVTLIGERKSTNAPDGMRTVSPARAIASAAWTDCEEVAV